MTSIVFTMFGAIGFAGILTHLLGKKAFDTAIYILVAILLILICGLKVIGSDQDSAAYLNYFNMSDYEMSLVAEPTFIYIAKIARLLSADNGIRYLFLIYAIIGVTLKFYAIHKLTELRWLSVLTYFSTYFLLHEFTQIRAAVASGLLLLSIKFVLERRAAAFLLTIAGASIFHYSAMLALPLYFLTTSTLTHKEKIIIGLAVPAGILFHLFKFDIVYVIPIELIRSKIAVYTEVEDIRAVKLNVFNMVYIVKYAMLYVFLIFSDAISKKSAYFSVLVKIYAISMFCYLALSFNAVFAMRISELFGVVEILLIPMMYYAIKPRSFAIALIVSLAAANLALGIYQAELIQQASW